MILSEILVEKIVIGEDVHHKINTAIDKWLEYVKDKLPEDNRYHIEQQTSWISEHHKEVEEKLRRYLANVVQQIVKQNKPQIDDPNYAGHKISIEIEIDEYRGGEYGAVYSRWRKLFTQGQKYIYRNYMQLNITPYEVVNYVRNPTMTRRFKTTITHEMLHLIQGLKHPQQQVYSKRYYNINKVKPSDEESYLLDKVEIDSYAQGTASAILIQSQQSNDPVAYIKQMIGLLKLGTASLFGKEIVPNQRYESIRDLFKKPSNDPAIQRAKDKAWKRYNKKIMEKLMHYVQK